MSDKLLLDHQDRVLTLTLNRPDRLNAIDIEMLDALVCALADGGEDDTVGAIVLRGAGRVFCAGADIGQMVDRTPADWQEIVDHYLDPVRLIASIEKPIIARCHGDVVGGGLGLSLACDFRVGSRDSRYCTPFINLGLAGCDMSSGYYLPRLIGMGRATDMMMTGRFVDAKEAFEIGLLSRLVDENELDDTVMSLARSFASGPTGALEFTKKAIRRSMDNDIAGEFDYEIYAQVQCLQSDAHRERVAAFFEKRGR
jgi:2-(1,2-epoxy-1,2-dihydrophenyl)acetyl-CoA isomerase|tara:strand:+ start:670 stop:1434 length:765 start_codon:yes stop_codon:yes gene_type:complete